MPALELNGSRLAAERAEAMSVRVSQLLRSGAPAPVLATILVGEDPASATYVRMKQNACRKIGIDSRAIVLGQDTTTEALLAQIEQLNRDASVSGILLQHPVPEQIDERVCFDAIQAEKDTDGVTCTGFGRLSMGLDAYGSATPTGIMRMLAHYGIELSGRHAVIVGRSPILGKPMAAMLLNADCTVSICHSRTRDLPGVVHSADLVVAALGRPRFIPGQWIADDAVVVDAGYHPAERCGDIDLDAALIGRVSAYTPVPGGVGPMTISALIENTLQAAERTAGIHSGS